MIVLVILAVWFLVAVPVALLVGGAVRLRDRGAPVRLADNKAPTAERDGRTVA